MTTRFTLKQTGTITMLCAIDKELTQTLHTQMPLAHTMELEVLEATKDRTVTAADWQPRFCGMGGVLHGGFLMSLADGTGATLTFLSLRPGESTTTVESKTNFFRPVTGGKVCATSTLIHRGRTTIVIQTDITNETGSIVSRTIQTQIVRPAER